ncbi:MAG: hypothetical protein JKY15_04235 [Deltaproteobacteria bacterium]|nr:hypothetical protein [Deltaproteobacteria bacterium]
MSDKLGGFKPAAPVAGGGTETAGGVAAARPPEQLQDSTEFHPLGDAPEQLKNKSLDELHALADVFKPKSTWFEPDDEELERRSIHSKIQDAIQANQELGDYVAGSQYQEAELTNCIARGANPNMRFPDGHRYEGLNLAQVVMLRAPMHTIEHEPDSDNIKILKFLLDHGADPNSIFGKSGGGFEGISLAQLAVVKDDFKMLVLLLDKGVHPNQQFPTQGPFLKGHINQHYAGLSLAHGALVQWNRVDMLKLLADKGANLDAGLRQLLEKTWPSTREKKQPLEFMKAPAVAGGVKSGIRADDDAVSSVASAGAPATSAAGVGDDSAASTDTSFSSDSDDSAQAGGGAAATNATLKATSRVSEAASSDLEVHLKRFLEGVAETKRLLQAGLGKLAQAEADKNMTEDELKAFEDQAFNQFHKTHNMEEFNAMVERIRMARVVQRGEMLGKTSREMVDYFLQEMTPTGELPFQEVTSSLQGLANLASNQFTRKWLIGQLRAQADSKGAQRLADQLEY